MWFRGALARPLFKLLNYAKTNGAAHSHSHSHSEPAKRNSGAECASGLAYKTRLARPRDYATILNFMNEWFYKCEPPMVYLGFASHEPVAAPLQKMMLDMIKDGMTIIAEDREHCLLGAVVNTSAPPWEPEEMMHLAKCSERGPVSDLIEFMAYVSAKPNLWHRYGLLKIFECATLAVHTEYQGFGIASRLVEESWCLARDCGYRLFRIDCTSSHTAQIAKNYGWERVCTIPYCGFVKNGRSVFKNVKKPHTDVQVYIDRFKNCKAYRPACRKRG